MHPAPPDGPQRLHIGASGVWLQALGVQAIQHCTGGGTAEGLEQDEAEQEQVTKRCAATQLPSRSLAPSPPPLSLAASPGTAPHQAPHQAPHPPVVQSSLSEGGGRAAARLARHWMARLRTPARLSSSSASRAWAQVMAGKVGKSAKRSGGSSRMAAMDHAATPIPPARPGAAHGSAAPPPLQPPVLAAPVQLHRPCARSPPDLTWQLRLLEAFCCAPSRTTPLHSPFPRSTPHPLRYHARTWQQRLLEAFWVGQAGAVPGGELGQDVEAAAHNVRRLHTHTRTHTQGKKPAGNVSNDCWKQALGG